MKKTYLNPEIVVVKLHATKMLMISMEISEETTDTFDARGGDFDDEE